MPTTLTQREIEAHVVEIITKELKLNAPFDQKDKLVDDLGADSMGLVEISMALEEQFDIDVSGDDTITFNTVADIVTCVKKKLGVE